MLIEILENKVLINKNPVVQNIRFNIDPWQKLFRLKMKYIATNQDLDLAVSYTIPKLKVSITSATLSMNITARELISNISFQEELYFNLYDKTIMLKGVKVKFKNIYDLVEFVTDEIVSKIEKNK